jgi:prophage regulatory protein
MNRLLPKANGPIPPRDRQQAGVRPIEGLSGGGAELEHPSQKPRTAGPLKLLRFPTVRDRTGLSRSTIWRLERSGDFPRHRRISANTVAWLEDDVTAWIESKIRDLAV